MDFNGWADVFKVALGGLLGGLSTLIVSVYQSKSVLQKLRFERRSKILADVVQRVELYFGKWLLFNMHCYGVNGAFEEWNNISVPSLQLGAKPLLDGKYNELLGVKVELAKASELLLAAQADLFLLGEKECVRLIDLFLVGVIEAVEGCTITLDNIDMTHSTQNSGKVRDARKSFYEAMEKAFKRT